LLIVILTLEWIMKLPYRALVAMIAGLALVAAGCGDDDDTAGGGGAETDTDRPTIVVTTTILGDVVENLVGDELDVVTIMPVGADPHDFQASARQVAQIGEAEVLIVSGAGFEEGLLDVIEAAEGDGVVVFEAISAVDTIEFGEGGHDHDDRGEDDRGEDEHHDDADDHGHDGADPHFWTDPARTALAAEAIAEFLIANVDGVDAGALRASAEAYIAELEALDTEIVEKLAPIGEERRVLVTNHDSFGYFADRYGFEVAGTVIPSGSTADGASARQLAELVEVIQREGVPAIFAETTVSDELARTLAAEVGDEVAVVDLYTGSLGEPGSDADTYVAMVRTNAQRIVDALAG
jgi:zinc/manganese transport system substrate-binding protein